MDMIQIVMMHLLHREEKVATRATKKKNPIAKALKFFTPKVIRDKKKYRRQDDKIWKRKHLGVDLEINAQVVNGKLPLLRSRWTVYLFLFIRLYLDALHVAVPTWNKK